MVGVTHSGNSGTTVYYLGTGTSFDVSNIPGYQNLTANNFIVAADSLNNFNPSSEDLLSYCRIAGNSPSVSYNSTTGIVTVNNKVGTWNCGGNANGHDYSSSGNVTMNLKVFLVKGKIKSM